MDPVRFTVGAPPRGRPRWPDWVLLAAILIRLLTLGAALAAAGATLISWR